MKDDILYRLTREGQAKVDSRFLSRDVEYIHLGEEDVGLLEREIELSKFKKVTKECILQHNAFDTAMDAWLAPKLHQALPLYRSEAADTKVWAFLASVAMPEYVRHRFERISGGIISRERFLGSIKRNTFARLWWGAELTVEDEDYSRTEYLFTMDGAQDFYEAIFGRTFSYYAPAMRASLNVWAGESREVIREATKAMSQLLTTLVLENMTQEELEDIMTRIAQEKKLTTS